MAVAERNFPFPFASDVSTVLVDLFRVWIAPTENGVLDFASKAALVQVSHDGDMVALLVHRLSTLKNDLPIGRVASLNDEATRIWVPTILSQLVFQPCDTDVSCHFEVSKTSRSLEDIHWWLGVGQWARWWIRRYFLCQPRNPTRRTVC